MERMRICFEVDGLAADEHGNPSAAGMQLDFGNAIKTHIDYEELIENIDIPMLLNKVLPGGIINPENVRIITPEEYDEKYAE